MFERLVTHSGKFHADDVFAAATLRLLAPVAAIERTRDPEALQEAVADGQAVVFDVGDHFDPQGHNFDHHQRGFDRAREDGVAYAAFGLVWEAFGPLYCRVCLGEEPDEETIEEVAARVEERLVRAVDAADCGVLDQQARLKDEPEVELAITNVSDVIDLYNPMGRQPAQAYDEAFERAMRVAGEVLEASTRRVLAFIRAEQVVRGADDGSPVLVLREYVPWHAHAGEHLRFVLSPALDGSGWMVEAVQDDFVPRCPLPAAWAGRRGEELAGASGVGDAIFCHRARFIAAARSEEGARRMAALALEGCQE